MDFDPLDIVKVSCGAFHTLMVGRDGKMYSFGNNVQGKLGTKEDIVFKPVYSLVIPYKLTPPNIQNSKWQLGEEKKPGQFKQISAGYSHSLAVN